MLQNCQRTTKQLPCKRYQLGLTAKYPVINGAEAKSIKTDRTKAQLNLLQSRLQLGTVWRATLRVFTGYSS